MSEKPNLYLDVDGVLWVVKSTGVIASPYERAAAPGLGSFLAFAFEHYNVKWLTS